ncbi:MAG: hypothetical protein LC620_08865 [Halobacteriales archaeon]|nr:hypothetical protein [Halobacteriales archaeon]
MITIEVLRLRAQKDEYKLDEESSSVLETDFFNSKSREASIVQLKRVVVSGICQNELGKSGWKATISQRSGLVVVSVEAQGVVSSEILASYLCEKVSAYGLDREWRGLQGFDQLETHANGATICATTDAQKLVDIFHHLRDFGPFTIP